MDEESKQLLEEFEKEMEPDIPDVDEESAIDWKKKHDTLLLQHKTVTDKRNEYQRLLDKQMSMMRYMCEGAKKIGMTFDEMHMIGGGSN
jgi:hypothetical protein